jgi:hypothetical protein
MDSSISAVLNQQKLYIALHMVDQPTTECIRPRKVYNRHVRTTKAEEKLAIASKKRALQESANDLISKIGEASLASGFRSYIQNCVQLTSMSRNKEVSSIFIHQIIWIHLESPGPEQRKPEEAEQPLEGAFEVAG